MVISRNNKLPKTVLKPEKSAGLQLTAQGNIEGF